MNLKLAAIIFFAAIIRISALDSHDFWFDEAFTYHVAKLPLRELIQSISADNNPPFYYLIMHYLLKIGSDEIFLRIPSVAFSLATIPIIFILAKKLINTHVAKLSVLLFTISPLSIYLSTESRLHSLALLLAVAVTLSFFHLPKNLNPMKVIIFVILLTIGFYTQYYIALLLIPFTLIVLKTKRFKTKKWLVIISIPALFMLPWILYSVQTSHANCWCPNTFLSLPASLVAPAVAGVGIVTMRNFISLPFPILVLFSTISVVMLLLFLKGLLKGGEISKIYLIMLIIISSIGLFLPVFSPKGFSIFIPLYLIIVATGIDSLKTKRVLVPPLVILLGFTSVVQINNPFFRGERLKEMANIVSNDQNIPVGHTSLVTFYSSNFYTSQKQKNILITTNYLSPTTVKYIGGKKEKVNQSIDKIWLVDTIKWPNDIERQSIVDTLYREYQIKMNYQIDNIFVSLLERK